MAHGVTTEMQAQFAELRREQRAAVAERVLAIVGTRQPRNADLVAHDVELRVDRPFEPREILRGRFERLLLQPHVKPRRLLDGGLALPEHMRRQRVAAALHHDAVEHEHPDGALQAFKVPLNHLEHLRLMLEFK